MRKRTTELFYKAKEVIHNTITIRNIIQHFNITTFKNDRRIICSAHNDNTPSMYIYDNTNTVKCFVCGVRFDVIGFTQQHLNLSFWEAIDYLNDNFRLNIYETSQKEKHIINKKIKKVNEMSRLAKEKQQKIDYWVNQIIKIVRFYEKVILDVKPYNYKKLSNYALTSECDLYIYIKNRLPFFEYLLDIFTERPEVYSYNISYLYQYGTSKKDIIEKLEKGQIILI